MGGWPDWRAHGRLSQRYFAQAIAPPIAIRRSRPWRWRWKRDGRLAWPVAACARAGRPAGEAPPRAARLGYPPERHHHTVPCGFRGRALPRGAPTPMRSWPRPAPTATPTHHVGLLLRGAQSLSRPALARSPAAPRRRAPRAAPHPETQSEINCLGLAALPVYAWEKLRRRSSSPGRRWP